ncbi:MAG: patatin-like phospholipase family protein [Amphritea sp.]
MAYRQILCALIICTGMLGLSACSSTPERTPLPPELINVAEIHDIPEARFWSDEWPKFSTDIFKTYTKADFIEHFSAIYGKPHNYLAISGGGAKGAFGAGLLAGWAETGTRPEFTMVTGVSTGALTHHLPSLAATMMMSSSWFIQRPVQTTS